MAAPRTTAPRGKTGSATWGTSIDIGGTMQFLSPGQQFPAGTTDYWVTIYYDPSLEDIAAGGTGRQYVKLQVDTTWTRQQIDLGLQNLQIERREALNWSSFVNPGTGKASP